MPFQERGLTIFVDLDGTQTRGRQIGPLLVPVVSIATMRDLLSKKFSISPTPRPLRESRPSSRLVIAVNTWFHSNRPLTEDSNKGLIQLADMRDSLKGRDIIIEVLSGRQPYLHQLTGEQLADRLKWYFDSIRLNTSGTSTGFKEMEVEDEVVNKKRNVVLIDDDEKASQKVARIQDLCVDGQKVMVLEIGNISNKDGLLKYAGIKRPDNIKRVATFTQAVSIIKSRVYAGQL